MSASSGRAVRLKRLFRRRDVTGHPDMPLLSVYRDLGVVEREGREDNFNRPGDDLGAYRMVRRGDLVLNKMKTWQGSLGISPYAGIVSPAYFVAEPISTDHPRFLHYLLRSQPLVAEYAKRSKGIRPSQWDLPWEEFRDIEVILPPAREQEAIARFLDRETARIDALGKAKEDLIGLLDERLASQIDFTCWGDRPGHVALRRFLQGVTQGWSPDCYDRPADEGEWGVVKAGCVKRMGFNAQENKALPPDMDVRPELVIRNGDLLVNRASGSTDLVGNAGIVEATPSTLMLCDKIFRLNVRPNVNARFLMYAMSTPTARAFIEPRLTGNPGTAYNVAQDVLLSIPIPDVSADRQQWIVDQLDRSRRLTLRASDRLARQMALLAERRQALVSTSVTWNLEAAGAVSV